MLSTPPDEATEQLLHSVTDTIRLQAGSSASRHLAGLIRALYLDGTNLTFDGLLELDAAHRQTALMLIQARLNGQLPMDAWEAAYERVKALEFAAMTSRTPVSDIGPAALADSPAPSRAGEPSSPAPAVVRSGQDAKWLISLLVLLGAAAWTVMYLNQNPPQVPTPKTPLSRIASAPAAPPSPPAVAPSADTRQDPIVISEEPRVVVTGMPEPGLPESLTVIPSPDDRPAGTAPAEPSGIVPASTKREVMTPGWIRFNVRPWGQIYIDGENKGPTPPIKKIAVSPGRHVIEVRNHASTPFRQTIVLDEKTTVRVAHTFR